MSKNAAEQYYLFSRALFILGRSVFERSFSKALDTIGKRLIGQ
jgi:hypothetical protein